MPPEAGPPGQASIDLFLGLPLGLAVVASDTVVGIVGAVLLVAVMGAVFTYEYTHPAEAEQGGSTDNHTGTPLFPQLTATEDIDHDGIPNGQDADVDGDGVANTQDADVTFTQPFQGTSPPVPVGAGGLPLPGGASGEIYTSPPFFVGHGAQHINGTVAYTSSTPSPAPASPGISFTLVDAVGTAHPADCGQVGTTVSCTFDLTSLAVGNYTVHANEDTAGPGVTFTGSILVHYGTAQMEATTGR